MLYSFPLSLITSGKGCIFLLCFLVNINCVVGMATAWPDAYDHSDQEKISDLQCLKVDFGNTLLNHKFPEKSMISVMDIQLGMQKNESYILFEEDNCRYYGLLINKSELEIYYSEKEVLIGAAESLTKNFDSFRNQNFETIKRDFAKNASILYEDLIQPVENKLNKNLKIFPTGILAFIPWSALHPNVELGSEPHYLVFDHEISIRKEIDEMAVSSVDKADVEIIAVAPDFTEQKEISNAHELRSISSLFKLHTGNVITDLEGLQESVACSHPDIIHIASHSILNQKEWLSSGILMSSEEGRFDLKSISSMKIEAKMVFVNTCNSGKPGPDHVHSNSISASFIKAGARASIGTLWEIDDKAANKIAEHFYRQISKGNRSSASLRKAQIAYIQKAALKSEIHPYYWAAFQLYGQDDQIISKAKFEMKRIFSILIAILTSFSMLNYYFGYRLRLRLKNYA